MRSERARDWIYAALLAVFVLLFFADILFAGLNLYVRDISRAYYPERRVLSTILTHGEFPFWNPLFAAGQPLAANPGYQAFYPPQWLLRFGSFRDAFHFELILHYPLAAAGMYLLSRSLGARRLPSLFAALIYALGGPLTTLSNLVPFLFAMAWLPWLALFFREGKIALASIVLGLILLIGDVSMILQAGALVGIYGIYKSRIRAAVMVVVLATLIGAVQIFPALDHQRDSGRAVALPYEVVMQWPTHPTRLFEAVWPTMFGSASADAQFYWGSQQLLGREKVPWLLSFYPGVLATILVITALLTRQHGTKFVLAVTTLSLLLAIGPYGPLFPLLYRAGFTSVRYPEKFALSAVFVLSVFAAVAADAAISSSRFRRYAAIVSTIIAAATAVIVAITRLPDFVARFARFWRLAEPDVFLAERFASGMLLSLAIIAVITILLWTEGVSPKLRVALLLLAVIIDLGIRNPGWMLRTTADYYDPPPAARRLAASNTPVRIYNYADWQRYNEPQPPLPIGVRPWIIRNGLMPLTHMTWGFGGVLEVDVTETTLIPTREFASIVDTLRGSGRSDRLPLLLQMAGASHIGTLQPLDAAVISDPRRFDEVDPVRFTQVRNNGRFYFAEQIVQSPNAATMLRALWSTDQYPLRTAFVDGPTFAAETAAPHQPASGRIMGIRETSNSIALNVESAGRAFLVIAVTPHKYWRATIDGRDAQLYRTNTGFQGLIIDAGAHRVELRYRNPVVVICGWISIAGVLIVILMAIAGRLRSRGSQQPSPH